LAQNPEHQVHFIVADQELDRNLVGAYAFTPLKIAKLPRYWSLQYLKFWQNLYLNFKISYRVLKDFKPEVVFCKGGFVAFPVAVLAFFLKIPLLAHESDSITGLTNRIIAFLATKIAYSFPDPRKTRHPKYILSGVPLSKDFQTGSIEQAERFLGFPKEQASILVLGGSQGALQLNELASRLCTQHPEWNIILIAGPGKKIALSADNLRQYEYLDEELISLIKKADLVVTRAGATFLFELALAGKAMLILPLLTSANNHQYYNAQYFKELSMVIDTNQSLDAIYQDLETNILRYWSGQISLGFR